jgi:hypothetical protein
VTAESDIFMRAIIGLCGGLNLSITAEGVETEGQASAAVRHGGRKVFCSAERCLPVPPYNCFPLRNRRTVWRDV